LVRGIGTGVWKLIWNSFISIAANSLALTRVNLGSMLLKVLRHG